MLMLTRIYDKSHQGTISAMLWSRTAYHSFGSRVGISANKVHKVIIYPTSPLNDTPEDVDISIYHLSSSKNPHLMSLVSTAWHIEISINTPRN